MILGRKKSFSSFRRSLLIWLSIVRSVDNRSVIIPNGTIYTDTITNFSARETRRIDMIFGISYDDDLRKAREIMEGVIDADERILAEPEPEISLRELADSSVNFNVRPWVNSEDYWGVRSDIIEQIKLAFDENGISIPYPQLDVHTGGAD